MKSLFISFSLLTVMTAQSQSKTFVRIFDDAGKKTHKGFLVQTSDSSLTLSTNETTYEIPISKIATIKLRRSFGHTVLLTSLIVGGSFAILGAATADPDAWILGYTAGEGALGGFILGAASGALAGSIVAGTRNRPIFEVNRNRERWMKAKSLLNSYLPVQSK